MIKKNNTWTEFQHFKSWLTSKKDLFLQPEFLG